ncbi:MAG: hypothetical protein ACI4QR_02300 [Eubacteriales bacterium]
MTYKEKTKVLFVCSMNTCRSPMAAAILSEFGGDKYAASSAGTFVFGSSPISKDAAFMLESVGIAKRNYLIHKSRPVSEKLMKENDIIVAMTAGHRDILVRLYPGYEDKIKVFPEDVGDFPRGDIVAYQLGYVKLKKGIEKMFLSETEE